MAGCGRYAGGQGYNSIGHFCGGWAGNCGDGGIGGSTWYLVCDRCREKYLREKQTAAREKVLPKGISVLTLIPLLMEAPSYRSDSLSGGN